MMVDALLVFDSAMDVTAGPSADVVDFGIADAEKGGTPRRAEGFFAFVSAGGTGPLTLVVETSSDNATWEDLASATVDAGDLSEGSVVRVPLPPQGMKQYLRANAVAGTATGVVYAHVLAG